MIEAHVIDSWTRVADRRSTPRQLILARFGRRCSCSWPGSRWRCRPARRRGGWATRPRPCGWCSAAASRSSSSPSSSASVVRPEPLAGVGAAEGRHPQHHGAVDHPGGDLVGLPTRARGSWPSPSRRADRVDDPIVRLSTTLGALSDPLEVSPPDSGADQFRLLPVDGFVTAGGCGVCSTPRAPPAPIAGSTSALPRAVCWRRTWPTGRRFCLRCGSIPPSGPRRRAFSSSGSG